MLIDVVNVSKSYKSKEVLNKAFFSIDEPQIVALVGNNGAGKTTLIKLIMGYENINSGEIRLFGACPMRNESVANNVILIDENASYIGLERLDKIIQTYSRYAEMFDKDKCLRIMRIFKLETKQYYKKMSKGMKLQFNIALGLACNRPIVIMDEPVAGLDEVSRYNFYTIINKEFMENPRLFIISTHLLGELENLCNSIIVIDNLGNCVHERLEYFGNKYLNVCGKSECVELSTANVWHSDYLLMGNMKNCIIQNNLTREMKKYAADNNIEFSAVKPHEACRIICNGGDFKVEYEKSI